MQKFKVTNLFFKTHVLNNYVIQSIFRLEFHTNFSFYGQVAVDLFDSPNYPDGFGICKNQGSPEK
jgi:hypothetical protein